MAGKELTKVSTPVTLAVPDELKSLVETYGAAGLEDMGVQDKATPFIGIIQGLSPQIDKNKPQYIKGAEIGDIFSTVTSEVWKNEDGGLQVVPVLFQKLWIVWVPRKQGGGFIGTYADPQLKTPLFVPPSSEGYDGPQDVVETAQYWVLAQGNDGLWAPAIISMKSTALKASRSWNTLMTIASQKHGGAPVFIRTYKVTTAQQTNEKGTFANFKIEDNGFTDPTVAKLAAEFRSLVKKGAVKADYAKAVDAEGEGTSAEPTPF